MNGKAVLALSLAATGGIVAVVHYNQRAERARMFDGVLRDVERQQAKAQRRDQ
jgi:hypothetical protein